MSHYLYLDHVIQNDNCADLYSTRYIFNIVSHYFYSAHLSGNRLLIVGARVYNPVQGQKGMTHIGCHKYGNNAPFMLRSNWVLERSEAALPLIYYHSVFAEFATCRKFHLMVWDITCL